MHLVRRLIVGVTRLARKVFVMVRCCIWVCVGGLVLNVLRLARALVMMTRLVLPTPVVASLVCLVVVMMLLGLLLSMVDTLALAIVVVVVTVWFCLWMNITVRLVSTILVVVVVATLLMSRLVLILIELNVLLGRGNSESRAIRFVFISSGRVMVALATARVLDLALRWTRLILSIVESYCSCLRMFLILSYGARKLGARDFRLGVMMMSMGLFPCG